MIRTIKAGVYNNIPFTDYDLYADDTGITTITGFSGGEDGSIVNVISTGRGTLEFIQNSKGSLKVNRILFGGKKTLKITSRKKIRNFTFMYDGSIWQYISYLTSRKA